MPRPLQQPPTTLPPPSFFLCPELFHPEPPPISLVCDLRPSTPIIPHNLLYILHGHPDAIFLFEGFSQSFWIPHTPAICQSTRRNHASAHSNPNFLDQCIVKEKAAGCITGPFPFLPLDPCFFSPLGLVPKHEQGTFCVIHDLSFPKGRGFNDLTLIISLLSTMKILIMLFSSSGVRVPVL